MKYVILIALTSLSLSCYSQFDLHKECHLEEAQILLGLKQWSWAYEKYKKGHVKICGGESLQNDTFIVMYVCSSGIKCDYRTILYLDANKKEELIGYAFPKFGLKDKSKNEYWDINTRLDENLIVKMYENKINDVLICLIVDRCLIYEVNKYNFFKKLFDKDYKNLTTILNKGSRNLVYINSIFIEEEFDLNINVTINDYLWTLRFKYDRSNYANLFLSDVQSVKK